MRSNKTRQHKTDSGALVRPSYCTQRFDGLVDSLDGFDGDSPAVTTEDLAVSIVKLGVMTEYHSVASK